MRSEAAFFALGAAVMSYFGQDRNKAIAPTLAATNGMADSFILQASDVGLKTY